MDTVKMVSHTEEKSTDPTRVHCGVMALKNQHLVLEFTCRKYNDGKLMDLGLIPEYRYTTDSGRSWWAEFIALLMPVWNALHNERFIMMDGPGNKYL